MERLNHIQPSSSSDIIIVHDSLYEYCRTGFCPAGLIGQVCILSQTWDGPLLFSKEHVNLTCRQGYLSVQHGTTTFEPVFMVKCLTQEHNTYSLAPVGFELWTMCLPVCASNHCATHAHLILTVIIMILEGKT